MTIGIVGLGLIGGSMAKSIKSKTEHTVFGSDLNEETVNTAKLSGAIDDVLTNERLPICDIVMLAVSPTAVISWTEAKAPLIKGTLIDLCGVKRHITAKLSILAEQNEFTYIGGHPMAGKEVSGFANSSDRLFDGASMILVPMKNSDIRLLESLGTFFLSVGFGKITFSTPEQHDKTIAYTSQLAHITSSAYIKSPTAQQHMGFSAGSYKDMTRVARLDEELWTELFLENSDYLASELKLLISNLTDYLSAIESNDEKKLRQMLKNGRELKMTAGGE